ncbi:MAG: hypothetical protein ACKOOI_02795, partial [Pirellula sp.]
MQRLKALTPISLLRQGYESWCWLCIFIIGSGSLVQAQDRLGLTDAPAYAPEEPITGQLELVGST